MITYRKASEDDMDFLLKLRESALREHVEAAGIVYDEAEQRERLLEGFEFAYIILYNNNEAGLLKVDDSSSLWKIVDFQLLPEYRKLEIEALTLNRVTEGAFKKRVDVTCDIYKSDPAFELYNDRGFKIISEDDYSCSVYYSHREALEAGVKRGYFGELRLLMTNRTVHIVSLVGALVLTFILLAGDSSLSQQLRSLKLWQSTGFEGNPIFSWLFIALPIYFIVLNVICVIMVVYKSIGEE